MPDGILVDIICKDPGPLTNGEQSTQSLTFPQTIHYSCDTGYILTGSKNRNCTSSGAWTGTEPSCVRECCCEKLSLINIIKVLHEYQMKGIKAISLKQRILPSWRKTHVYIR